MLRSRDNVIGYSFLVVGDFIVNASERDLAATTAEAIGGSVRQSAVFSSADLGAPREAFERFCQLTAAICDVHLLGEVEDFQTTSSTLHLGNAVLIDAQNSAVRYDRTPEHVARGGIDHFQAAMYLAGGAEMVADGRALRHRPGDICLIDMAQPNQTHVIPADDSGLAHVMTFMLPRMLLAPLFPSPASIPALALISRDTAYGRMLGEHLLALRRHAPHLTQAESQAAIQSLVHLLVGALGSDRKADETTASLAQEALLPRLKHYIEDNLGADSLGVESLCGQFGLSRASLYRVFAPLSPAQYIQQRRLHRAFAMLVSPALRRWRIVDVALECHFGGDATFIRAFRREFGITPGEARERARTLSGAPPGSGIPKSEPDAEAVRWVSELTGAMPAPRS